MSQFLLDADVIAELWKNNLDPEVLAWLDSAEWLIPVVIIAEIQEGAESTPDMTRKEEISRRLTDFLGSFPRLSWIGMRKQHQCGQD